jgi:hypothetical protein
MASLVGVITEPLHLDIMVTITTSVIILNPRCVWGLEKSLPHLAHRFHNHIYSAVSSTFDASSPFVIPFNPHQELVLVHDKCLGAYQMTKISLVRAGGRGIKGTYQNASCHANALTPLIKNLEPFGLRMGFKEWKQGHNVHIFITEDGRKFDIVPLRTSGGGPYFALRLRMRTSRTVRVPLFDYSNEDQLVELVAMLKSLAKPLGAGVEVGGEASD